jgi:hypothetical protein
MGLYCTGWVFFEKLSKDSLAVREPGQVMIALGSVLGEMNRGGGRMLMIILASILAPQHTPTILNIIA